MLPNAQTAAFVNQLILQDFDRSGEEFQEVIAQVLHWLLDKESDCLFSEDCSGDSVELRLQEVKPPGLDDRSRRAEASVSKVTTSCMTVVRAGRENASRSCA